MTYGWPDAYKKAKMADQILRTRLERLGLKFEAIHSEYRRRECVSRRSAFG